MRSSSTGVGLGRPHHPPHVEQLSLLNVLWYLRKEGYAETAIVATRKRLRHLAKHTNLNNPEKVKEYRHWKATMMYHKTKDLLFVKTFLGHHDLRSTLRYTQLLEFRTEEYHSAVAKNIDEARKLIESGFEYVTEMEGIKLFRKRK